MSGKELEKNDPKKKDEFLEALKDQRPDLMFPDDWNQADRDAALEDLKPSRVKLRMLDSIPQVCKGYECPFANVCPLEQKGIAPVGRPCPIEASAVQQFFLDYVDELDVDTTRMVEVSLVRDLVDQEIQQLRKSWILAQEHFIQEDVIGIDAEGNVVMSKNLHKAVDYEDKIFKRKERLRNALLATRESKAKAGKSLQDSSEQMGDLMERLRQMEIDQEKARRKELGIEHQDDYIIDAEVISDEETPNG